MRSWHVSWMATTDLPSRPHFRWPSWPSPGPPSAGRKTHQCRKLIELLLAARSRRSGASVGLSHQTWGTAGSRKNQGIDVKIECFSTPIQRVSPTFSWSSITKEYCMTKPQEGRNTTVRVLLLLFISLLQTPKHESAGLTGWYGVGRERQTSGILPPRSRPDRSDLSGSDRFRCLTATMLPFEFLVPHIFEDFELLQTRTWVQMRLRTSL